MQAKRPFRLRPRHAIRAACSLLLGLVLVPLPHAQAKTPVSIELVLAVDTSLSVNGSEYELLIKGIADAFRRPEIIELIGLQEGIAVTLFQWSSEINQRYMIPWHLLTDAASVHAFAATVETAERDPFRGFTAIGGAIAFGTRLIAGNGYDGRQLKIDVSGDGRNNSGIGPAVAHQQAQALGIVINGLPIITRIDPESLHLDRYYIEEIIYGPGAFIEVADDYDDFARAFLRKLQREIAPETSRREAAPRRLALRDAHP